MRTRLGARGRALATALAAVAVAAAPAAQAAEPPADYDAIAGLSEPQYDTQRDVHRVPMADGTELYVEVVRPKADGRFPVILEASPYHGTLADRDGTRILPEPRNAAGKSIGLTGYFAPRGYAVVMMDLRGTGRSQGCLDHLGSKDASDLARILEWAGTQAWSNGRVGMTGHSYVGSTPSVAAAQDPDATYLKTIVPSAGLASMYDHQFQGGVPYFLQWAGPQWAYAYLATTRHLPPVGKEPVQSSNTGDDFGNNTQYDGCQAPQSALVSGEDQLSGRYADWHAERDHRAGGTAYEGSVFLVHGVNDNAARVPAMQWFTDRGGRPQDKLWLGQWDHGSNCCPTRRAMHWTYALHAWFDRELAQRDVETGPNVELFLADGTFEEARTGARTEVLTADAWPGSTQALRLGTSGDGALVAAPSTRARVPGSRGRGRPPAHAGRAAEAGQAGSVSFAGDPRGHADPARVGAAEFTTGPLAEDLVLAGVPKLRLSASTTAPRVHLIATLYDELPDGHRRRITQFSINPELRAGEDRREPVVPGQRYDLEPTAMAMAHHARAGHELVLRVTTSDPDKVPSFAVDPHVTVFTGPGATALELPVVADAVLHSDPLNPGAEGPAQPTVSGQVTVPAPGGGVRSAATSAFFEFEVLPDHDNARMAVRVEPRELADMDTYLQRRRADGTWEAVPGGVGESFNLTSETMAVERPAPGTYRVEVHGFATPPANPVELRVRFYNGAGEAG
jgi:uncharacterized protein